MKFRDGWNNRVLIVDDQDEIHQDFEEMLNPGFVSESIEELARAFDPEMDDDFLPKFELIHAQSGKEAYRIIKEANEEGNPIAIAYIDVRMPPGWSGVETTRRIRMIDREIEIVIMTAYTGKPLSEIVQSIELLHKLLYVRKPFAREEIQQMTIALVEKWNVESELAERNRQLALREQSLQRQVEELLTKVLSGFLPICAGCKKIRDEDDSWNHLDVYIKQHTDADITYDICPECQIKFYPEIYEKLAAKTSP